MKGLNWIWLDPARYPDRQSARYTGTWDGECENGTVVEFIRSYTPCAKIAKIELNYSSDGPSQLWIGGKFIGTGPVNIGGDFCFNDRPRENRYYSSLTLFGEKDLPEERILALPDIDGELRILSRVRLDPVGIAEFSVGRGGFALSGEIIYENGDREEIFTDENWLAVICPEYESAAGFDGRRAFLREITHAAKIPDGWRALPSPLPHRIEREAAPIGENEFTVPVGGEKAVCVEYSKIHAAFTKTSVICQGEVEISLTVTEAAEDAVKKTESLIFTESGEHIGIRMYGVGEIHARIINRSNAEATVKIGINEAFLPQEPTVLTETDDAELNGVLALCAHTLKYARQYIHLDSPKHCEPLACTGDYFIETEMEAFSTSDTALAEFDVIRTARVIEHGDGVMFHPTYSLIWVRMLRNVYNRCGKISLLTECEGALDTLFRRFRSYRDEGGLIDTPPSFMFVDWIVADGYSLHHPPKALGQGVINTFYFDALNRAAEVYGALAEAGLGTEAEAKANACRSEAERLKREINERLFDRERGMYFEGLNTPTPTSDLNNYLPENSEKRYYRINTNALAVAFGVIEGEAARNLTDTLLSSEEYGDYQPYFAHFVLMAVHKTGLDEKYLLKILDKWREPMRKCQKGLAEGFIPPEEGYSFDHSHAWGGTPLCSLPTALTSLRILKPGMSHIELSPRLLGFERATVQIPTPSGTVTVKMESGKSPVITAPEGVKIDLI